MSRTVKGSTSGVQSPEKALIISLRHSILIDCVSAEAPIRCAPEALLRCRVAKWTFRAFPIVLCLSTEASFIIPTSHVTSRDWLPQYSRATPRSLSSVHLYWEQTKRLFHLSFSIVSYLLLWNLVDWYRLSFVVVCNRSDGLMLVIVSTIIIDYWHRRFSFTHTQSVIFRLY
jgi:hypothetical protein